MKNVIHEKICVINIFDTSILRIIILLRECSICFYLAFTKDKKIPEIFERKSN